MRMNMRPEEVPADVIDGVAKLLAQSVHAQVMSERVGKVAAQVLRDEVELYTQELPSREGRPAQTAQRILIHGDTWQSDDESTLGQYYSLMDTKLRALGLKPDGMEREFCPLLVARMEKTEAEWALFDAVAKMLELDFDGAEFNNRLLQNANGLERRQEVLDLVIGLVVSIPSLTWDT